MIVTNLNSVRKGLTKATSNLDQSVMRLRDEMMAALIQLSKEEIKGRRPEGQRATAGQPPMNRTGNLRRSIRGEKFKTGFAKYEAIVGPTISYGRAVELGGTFAPKSWIGTSAVKGFPYMQPAFKKFQVMVPAMVSKHLKVGGR
jgi:hypothetical protein